MSVSGKEVEKEAKRKREVERELKTRIIGFLKERLLDDEPYCTIKEIENDFKKAGLWIKETIFLTEEKWIYRFLNGKLSIKRIRHKGEEYYSYRYKRWAKICSMFKN